MSEDEDLSNIENCLVILKNKESLTEETFNTLLAYPDSDTLYTKLKDPGISSQRIQEIMSSLIPEKRNAPSLFEILPREIRRMLFSLLSVQDLKSLSQTDSGLARVIEIFLKSEKQDLQSLIKERKENFKTFFNQLLRSEPEGLDALLNSRPDIIKPEDREITQCLIHLVKGEIEAVEGMITKNPDLLNQKGRIMDFSERTFVGEGIHLLEYALAAQDRPMTKMLLRHFPKTEEGEAAVASQYAQTLEMLQNEKAENHRAIKNLNGAIAKVLAKLGEYLKKKYDRMERGEFEAHKEEAIKAWCQGVGGAYREQPAWVIETMCEEGRDVAWLKQDLSKPVARDSQHLVRLFYSEHEEGNCGVTWVPERGWAGVQWGCDPPWGLAFVRRDRQVLALCQSARPGELPALESFYEGEEVPSMFRSGPARQ